MTAKLPYVLLIPLLLTSCVNKPVDDSKYKTENINVYYVNDKNNTTCDLRYYGKSVIPYISIKEFQKLLYRGRTYPEGRDKFDIKQNGKSYTITVAGDYTATFDVSKNTMASSNLWSFKNTNLTNIGDKGCVSYDGMPFTRVKSVSVDKPAKETVIDFSKYNLKIYGDKEDVYVPVTFATDLFSNENILQGAYNTKDLYIYNYTENEELEYFGGQYLDPIFEKQLNKEYLEYAYNELCLDYDIFLGRPGRSSLERYYDLSNGLDAALKSRPYGKKLIEYFKSTDLATHLAGSFMLGYIREDGGHSRYAPAHTSYYYDAEGHRVYPKWRTEEVFNKSQRLLDEIRNGKYPEFDDYEVQIYNHNYAYASRAQKLTKPSRPLVGKETYTKDGDLAYIHIDGFMGEIGLQNEWNKYYKGERDTIPFGDNFGGAVGAISYGVKQASMDDEVKHVVIDLSVNTGGSTDEMLFMIYLLTGSNKFYTHNTLNDNYFTIEYEFDLNFDKVFDEKDEEVRNLLNGKDISLISSKNGFSCGGISPIYLHDEGIFSMGEQCGGGSCSIYIQSDAFGASNRASTPSHTVNKNKVSVDIERNNMCDAHIEILKDASGNPDYSNFYDTNTLRGLISKHYSK